jgi:hypothetical protein
MEREAEYSAGTGSKLVKPHALAVADQHPADRGEADDHGHRDRPCADTDIADRLPLGFVLGDLTIPLLVFAIVHRLPCPVSFALD